MQGANERRARRIEPYAATRSERLPASGRQATPQMVSLPKQGWCLDGGSGTGLRVDYQTEKRYEGAPPGDFADTL